MSDSATPWTTAYQAPPSMGFSRQEYWSGVPLPSPKGDAVAACGSSGVAKSRPGLSDLFTDLTGYPDHTIRLWRDCTWTQIVCLQLCSARVDIWRRQWHPTPVLLPGESHGQRSLVGCSPWGRYESDTTEQLHFHFSLSCIGEGNGNPLQCSWLENPRDGGAWWAAIYRVAQSWTQLK